MYDYDAPWGTGSCTGAVAETRAIAYDEVLDRYDDSTNLRIVEASRATVGELRDYDRSAKHTDRRTPRGEGATYYAAATGIAAEGVGGGTSAVEGTFEILDGVRRGFIPGGAITGFPNQVVP